MAPPEPFAADPMPAVKETGATWIAVIPYAYTRPGQPRVQLPGRSWQWWGESSEGAQKTIRLAHTAGLRVMLKPQVYVPGGWTGALDFDSSDDWARWEADYAQYLLGFARLAASEHVAMLCIGTELKQALAKRPALILADEPTANLDRKTSEDIIALMRRMNEQLGATFVFSTHDEHLMGHARRIVRLTDGHIVADETRPAHG